MHMLILRNMPQEDRSKLDERMMQSVKRASRDADAMLVIIDASDRPEQTLTFLDSTFKEATVPTAVILNKARACQLSSLSVHPARGAFSVHAGLILSPRSQVLTAILHTLVLVACAVFGSEHNVDVPSMQICFESNLRFRDCSTSARKLRSCLGCTHLQPATHLDPL